MSIYKDAASDTVVSDTTIIVNPTGGDFTTLLAAITYANALTIASTARVLIQMTPGQHTLDNSGGAVIVNSRIHINGAGVHASRVALSTAANVGFKTTATGQCCFSNFTMLNGASSGGGIDIRNTSNFDEVLNIEFVDFSTGIIINGAGGTQYFFNVSGTATTGTIVYPHATGTTFITGLIFKGASGAAIYADAAATVSLNGCTFTGANTAIYGADAGATFVLSGCNFVTCTNVLRVGAGDSINATGCTMTGTVTSCIDQSNATGTVKYDGILDYTKLTIADPATVQINAIDSATYNDRLKRTAMAANGTLSKTGQIVALTAAGLTITLPILAGEHANFPITYYIFNQDAGTQTLTANAANNINGGAGGGSYTVAARACVMLVGFGTTWFAG